MRKRLMVVLIAGGLAMVLVGCGWISGPNTRPKLNAEFTAEVVPPLTIVVDGRGSTLAETWTWDWGDGSPPVEGAAVMRYTYADRGRYVVILTVTGPSAGGDPGPGPGPGPAVPGTPGVDSTYRVVDLLGDQPQAVIITFNQYGKPTGDVYAYLPLVLYGEASRDPVGGGLWYLWELVRVDPDTLEPIPYPAHADGYQPPIEYIRSQDMNWTVYLRGPGGCSPIPWLYRIRLIVRDAWGRQHEAVKYVRVW